MRGREERGEEKGGMRGRGERGEGRQERRKDK